MAVEGRLATAVNVPRLPGSGEGRDRFVIGQTLEYFRPNL